MKIKIERRGLNMRRLDEIKPGELFVTQRVTEDTTVEPVVWMKGMGIVTIPSTIPVVNVRNGEIQSLYSETRVIPVGGLLEVTV